MSWTEPFDASKLVNDGPGICLAYAMEACTIAAKSGMKYDLEPETYVAQYFDGVQPTGDEFLEFLDKLGFDSKAIHDSVMRSLREAGERDAMVMERAKAFFNLFQTEWRVTNEHVGKYIDADSIYYLIGLAVTDADSTKARLKAIKLHAEHRAMKAEVFAWLDDNMPRFKSMDTAAEAIAWKIVPMTFRTVRNWVGQWKKLRSASTP